MVPWALIALTVTTGMVDAISYLRLGHVFVANMTGNVVFLGFALAGVREISALGSLVALAAFFTGAFAGGKLVRNTTGNPHLLLQAATAKFVLGLCALALSVFAAVQAGSAAGYVLIALLGVAMGVQNAAARKIGVPDFTTTVLTMTITGIAADFAAGGDPKAARRLVSVISMFAGGFAGAALVLRSGVSATLSAIVLLFAITIVLAAITYNRQRTSASHVT